MSGSDRFRNSLSVLILLATTLVAGSALAQGNPPACAYPPAGVEEELSPPSIAIAANGDIFVAFAREYDTFDWQIVILRSNDDGEDWNEWGVLGDPLVGDSFESPQIRIAEGAFNERVFVAYRNESGNEAIEVAYANVNELTPSWTTVSAISYLRTAGAFPNCDGFDLDVRSSATDPITVAVAALIQMDYDEYEWRYAASIDGGSSYSAEIVVDSEVNPPIGSSRHDIAVALGDNDLAYLAVTKGDSGDYANPGLEYGNLYFYAASSNGTLAWPVTGELVQAFPYPLGSLSMRAEQNGDDIVIAADDAVAGTLVEFELWVSDDGGASWTAPPVDAGETPRQARIAWTSFGPQLVCENNGSKHVLRPTDRVDSEWESSIPWMTAVGSGYSDACFAEDPSNPGEYAMVLTAGDLSSWVDRIWFEASWRDQPGYGVNEGPLPQSGIGHFNSAPAIGDLDGDGLKEIVLTSRYLLAKAGGAANDYLSVHAPTGSRSTVELINTSPASAPALFDVDGDGDLEIFLGSASGGVEAFDHDLNRLDAWPVIFDDSSTDTWVSVGPITGYGVGEIVAVSGGSVHVLNPIGAEMPGWPRTLVGGEARGRAAIGDVDNDGATELVVAFTTGVVILNSDGSTQQVLAGPHIPSAGVSLVDLDGDGDLEIVGPMEDGFVLLVHHDGSPYDPAWPYDTGLGLPVSSVSIANLMSASSPAICFTVDSTVYALNPDGSLLPGYPTTVMNDAATEPILARVARPNVNRSQLIVGDDSGWVYLWSPLAETPVDWPHFYNSEQVMPPAVSDLDGDGVHELVLPIDDVLWVLDTGTEPLAGGSRRWAMSGHDRARSSCADCLPGTPTAADPALSLGSSVSFAGASPNPAPGRTSFSFSLASPAHVSLTLYDVRGRRVRELMSESKAAGAHLVAWDGRDHGGRAVASGNYFGRLVVSSGAVKRVLVRQMAVVH